MKKFACQYKVIRFAPFAETGEFANVGVALLCPASREFIFQLAPKRFGRVTSFFEGMDPAVYRTTIEHLSKELNRFKNLVSIDTHEGLVKQLFEDLLREKGSILRFSDTGVLLTENMDQALEDLYGFHVGRRFINRSHREQEMVKRLRVSLQQFDLQKVFKKQNLTDGLHEANFPFVRGAADRPLAAIKPLAFDQAAKKGVVENADQWFAKLRSLVGANVIAPEKLLISMADPILKNQTDNDLVKGYLGQIRKELCKIGVKAVHADDKSAVDGFLRMQAEGKA
ncbi:DUF3037 domain-containing protein [Neptuniibacter sp. SY11_33]|uniref:DUF3037 domain-containing protein n=1 Tax=unclassified Neptuniibacter TaxID=2630693 RepID=UPI0039F69905